ncbi:unnamed protein product [Rhizoctonia solani]|uniref:Uncharacterized protein n=1 Tax=Rhizoctonia solani TaxID=456999 RepID=A0A8H3HYZ3_9AGAM|nr:unnamed protein product [Rhizoctonia solani]
MESDIESTLDVLVTPIANIPSHEAAERIYKLGTDFINARTQCASSSAEDDEDVQIYGKATTPGVPTFFCDLWSGLIDRIHQAPVEEQAHEEHMTRLVDFVGQLQAKPHEGEEWLIRGVKCRWDDLPLLGANIRDCYREPFETTGPEAFDPSTLLSQEAQNAMAGAVQLEPQHLANEGTQSETIRLVKSRHQWLSYQTFISRLWRDCGRNEYDKYAIWALRPALEDWPEFPPACDAKCTTYEESAAYLALQVEVASIWICNTASLMYQCAEIYGPKGNPNWPKEAGTPGRGGRRWDGVDGYDREHKRWQVWKDVLGEVIKWCDGVAKDQMQGWKVRDAAVRALEAMKTAERQ